MLDFYLLPFFCFLYFIAIGSFCLLKRHEGDCDRVTAGALTGLMCYISAFCQMLGACEVNAITYGGRTIVYSKYLEWSINTTLITALILEGYEGDVATQFKLSVYSFGFCLLGIGACLTHRLWLKIFFTVLGCLLSAMVIYRLLEVSRHPVRQSRIALTNLWTIIICYPMSVVTWCMSPDVFGVISARDEFIWESCLSIVVKGICVSFAFSEAEYLRFTNQMWETPDLVFRTARTVLVNLALNHH